MFGCCFGYLLFALDYNNILYNAWKVQWIALFWLLNRQIHVVYDKVLLANESPCGG
jgi:hypothetical protein